MAVYIEIVQACKEQFLKFDDGKKLSLSFFNWAPRMMEYLGSQL